MDLKGELPVTIGDNLKAGYTTEKIIEIKNGKCL
jgi:hypothetical protein